MTARQQAFDDIGRDHQVHAPELRAILLRAFYDAALKTNALYRPPAGHPSGPTVWRAGTDRRRPLRADGKHAGRPRDRNSPRHCCKRWTCRAFLRRAAKGPRGPPVRLTPGAAAVTAAMIERIKGADVVFFDGTLFRDDEMIALVRACGSTSGNSGA